MLWTPHARCPTAVLEQRDVADTDISIPTYDTNKAQVAEL